MTYIEQKIEFLVTSAKTYCGTEATPFETRQMIAHDILELTGRLFSRRDYGLLRKAGVLLTVFPLLRKDANGLFLERLKDMEDLCLSIQAQLEKARNK